MASMNEFPLSWLLVHSFAPGTLVIPFPQNQQLQIPIWPGKVEEEPLRDCAASKSLVILCIL